jgi:hypothetical protein
VCHQVSNALYHVRVSASTVGLAIIADTVGDSCLLLDRLTNQRHRDFLEGAVSGYLTTCLQPRGRGRGLVTTETQYTCLVVAKRDIPRWISPGGSFAKPPPSPDQLQKGFRGDRKIAKSGY